MDGFSQDLRYALRHIGRAPGFACAVVAMLALAIGANSAFFSLVNAVVLRRLPVREPGRLVVLQATDNRAQQNRPLYYAAFRELAKLPVFEQVALYSGGGLFQIETRGALNEGLIEASTPGLFETLGLQPHLGRFFTPDDSPADRSAEAVVVLSFDFWRRAFGSDPSAIGERILIAGTPAVVIGVTPPEYKGFYADGGFGFSVPLTFLIRQMGNDPKRPVRGLNAIARLAHDASLRRARAAVDAAWPSIRVDAVPSGLSPTERSEIATQQITVASLAAGFSSLRRQYQNPLLVLQGVAAMLLAIACANLSGLLLARTAARERERAVCVAVGASRGRIVRQVLFESLIPTMAGAAVAVPIAWWTTKAAESVLWQGSAPLSRSLTPDNSVLAVTALSAVLTGLLVAALPAWIAAKRWPQGALLGARTIAGTTGRRGKALLVAQLAVSFVLLVGAGLFASSLRELRRLDPGVRTEGVRWSRLFAVPNGYRNQNDAAYYPDLVQRLSDVRGVRSVALASMFPTFFGFGNLVATQPVARAGASDPRTAADGIMENVTPRFFDTVGIPLLRGRDFSWSDDAQHPNVAIVNESLRQKLFPGGDAIGRQIGIGADPKRSAVEIVGVVGDASIGSYRLPHMPVVFRPRMQELPLARAPVMLYRTSGDPAVVDGAMQKVIGRLGHEYARRFYSLDEQVDLSLLQERLLAGLSSFFAGFAVLIAFVGLYAALAYAVTQRTREFGVRMALGAARGALVGLLLGDAMIVTLLGIAIGIPCALATGRLLAALLFGLTSWDPATIAAAAGFFTIVGLVAGLRPALRAASMDPMTALRSD